jgi:VIT1/CCC1 family predicted Fe2+/Mn2+ transporter
LLNDNVVEVFGSGFGLREVEAKAKAEAEAGSSPMLR